MKKYAGVMILFVLCFFAVKAYSNISVYPYAVDFDASSKKRVVAINVTNPTDEKKTYRISVIDMKQKPDGSFEEIPADQRPESSAAPYITFSPKQFTLDGKDMQVVNISRKPLLNAPDGEYTSHLKIQEVDTPAPAAETEQQKQISVEIKFKYDMTIPIYIKKGKTEGIAQIKSAKLTQGNGGAGLVVKLERKEGKKYFRGKIVAMAGKKIIAEIGNIRIYPSTLERNVFVPLKKEINAEELAGKKVKIVYKYDTGKEKGDICAAEFTP